MAGSFQKPIQVNAVCATDMSHTWATFGLQKIILRCGLIVFRTHHALQVMDSEERVAENCPILFHLAL